MKKLAHLVLFVALVFPVELRASETGVAVRSCDVMSEPYKDAKVVASLKEGDSIDILQRKGGWLQVSNKGKTGWVRMFYIRRGAPSEKASAMTEASGVLGMATGRAGSGNVVAATGVRGLDEEELKQAEFNEKEFQQLKIYRMSKQDAKDFAKQAGLKTQNVPFMQPVDGK